MKLNYYPDLMKVTMNVIIIMPNYWSSTSEKNILTMQLHGHSLRL